MEGFTFATSIRVRFAETDAQGIAHNASYFVWFEVARVEYLEEYAHGYQRLRDEGIEALVLESHARYIQPAVFDDRLRVHARCVGLRGARFRYEYAVERAGEVIADGWTAHATVDAKTLKPTRVPEWLAAAITAAEGLANGLAAEGLANGLAAEGLANGLSAEARAPSSSSGPSRSSSTS